jgi:hypothetical protein
MARVSDSTMWCVVEVSMSRGPLGLLARVFLCRWRKS